MLKCPHVGCSKRQSCFKPSQELSTMQPLTPAPDPDGMGKRTVKKKNLNSGMNSLIMETKYNIILMILVILMKTVLFKIIVIAMKRREKREETEERREGKGIKCKKKK